MIHRGWQSAAELLDPDRGPEGGVAPGRRTLTMSLPPRRSPDEPALQRKTTERGDGDAVDDGHTRQLLDAALRPDLHARDGGLPGPLRAGLERLSGFDLGDVNVHRDSAEPARLGALATARGHDIHLGPGQEQHLPHEAWHVVQQKRGSVAPTTQLKGLGVNDDDALEHEADVMGARAVELGATATAATPGLRHGTAATTAVQLVAPGPISHVTNSCFVAALINVCTVTPSLKNLLNPVSNVIAGGGGAPAALELQNLLWRAVNTVDANALVPPDWVRSIMASLVSNGLLQHADQSEDVNTIIAGVANRMCNGNAGAGQANGMDALATYVWPDGTTASAAFAQNAVPLMPPNTVVFNRQGAPMALPQAATPTFTHQIPHGGALVTYRLTSIVQRDVDHYKDARGNSAEHFVSLVDRSGAGNEWWRSDDIGPQVTAVPNLAAVGAAPQHPRPKGDSELASAMASRRQVIGPDSVSSEESPKDKAEGEPQQAGGGGFDATTGALTYVYQRADEAEAAGNNAQQVGNDGAHDQHAFSTRYMLSVAAHFLPDLDVEARRNRAISMLSGLMINPAVHALIASDPALFGKMYVNIKDPAPKGNVTFSGDPQVDKAKRGQRIHTVADQLHYVLQRLGAGPGGMANDPGFKASAGTELKFDMTQETAQEAQASALAKMIALYAGEDVRMPVYSHRVGPMLGRLEGDNPITVEKYYQDAATSLNAILTSKDEQGSNIRVTPATAGPGAYVATDSDNFYGPHGVAFDPRDLHGMPLSSKSTDNNKQHSAERTSAEKHQFRALGQPIPFAEEGHSKVAEIFVGTNPDQRKDVPGALKPAEFNPGILPVTIESLARNLLRQHLKLPEQPTQSHADPQHDQPKGSEEVYLMRELVIELEGLYEPLAWAAMWQNAPQTTFLAQMFAVVGTMRLPAQEESSSSSDEDEWRTD